MQKIEVNGTEYREIVEIDSHLFHTIKKGSDKAVWVQETEERRVIVWYSVAYNSTLIEVNNYISGNNYYIQDINA